jgi:hypothetical protein
MAQAERSSVVPSRAEALLGGAREVPETRAWGDPSRG